MLSCRQRGVAVNHPLPREWYADGQEYMAACESNPARQDVALGLAGGGCMDDITARIVRFLKMIEISVALGPISHPTVLPGIDIRSGGLVLDTSQRYWPGDLLHEAGHIAVTAPECRSGLNLVESDGGEEMAAIAWSYAAAVAIGIDPVIVFHEDGYRGAGAAFAEAFAQRNYFGVPLLRYWGMTHEPKDTVPTALAFPAMVRWLR